MIGEPQNEQECAERRCPDGGACHHGCDRACWRVFNAGPLTAAGWGDTWPPEVRDAENRKLLEHVTCVSHDETCWVGVVNAPQGLLNYQHRFEGRTPSEVLLRAADSLDLTGAKKVTVVVERVALEDSPRIADLLVRYREAREVQDDSTERASALRAELAALGIDAEARR